MAEARLAIGCDHAGYALKSALVDYLRKGGWRVEDCGTFGEAPVDYPDIGAKVARRVAVGEVPWGILICGSGIGMAIVANRFPGVRAAVALDVETARLSRQHNDTNVLALAGRRTSPAAAQAIVMAWLVEPFAGGRHQVRLDKIRALEATIGCCLAVRRARKAGSKRIWGGIRRQRLRIRQGRRRRRGGALRGELRA